jgi:hypothetical protein
MQAEVRECPAALSVAQLLRDSPSSATQPAQHSELPSALAAGSAQAGLDDVTATATFVGCSVEQINTHLDRESNLRRHVQGTSFSTVVATSGWPNVQANWKRGPVTSVR